MRKGAPEHRSSLKPGDTLYRSTHIHTDIHMDTGKHMGMSHGSNCTRSKNSLGKGS